MRRHHIILAIAVLCGCEQSHPANPDLQAFLDALEFGDRETLFELHLDSTTSSDWCTEKFRAIIVKAQGTRSDGDCAQIRALGESDLEQMRDELRLAVQVTAFACERPSGDCVDYGRRVFEETAATSALLVTPPASREVRRLFGDDDRAVAYVDFVLPDTSQLHRVLELRRVGERWRVTSGLAP